MQTNVSMQGDFKYSFTAFIVAVLIVIVCGIIAYIVSNYKHKQKEAVQKQIEVVQPINIEAVKQKYIGILNQIYGAFYNGNIGNRDTYKQLSICIRNFIAEATGIDVDKYTLMDIRSLNIAWLSTLVEEYYNPEFDTNTADTASKNDIYGTILKTKGIIECWN